MKSAGFVPSNSNTRPCWSVSWGNEILNVLMLIFGGKFASICEFPIRFPYLEYTSGAYFILLQQL